MIQIEKINTLKQAQKFSNQIIKEPKTYFLQGSWGSGKTEYLTEVEKIMKEKKFKFVKLELWNPKNKFSVEKQLFSTIHPIISWIINALGWCFIIASVIGSIILAIRGLLPNLLIQKNTTLLITMIAVILTTLYSFIQSKWLEVDRLLMFCSLKSLRSKRRPKVLVVDDFDRLNDTTQKELYIIFNAIHEKTRVIFIGDLSKIENIKDQYERKIKDYEWKINHLSERIEDKNLKIEKLDEIVNNLKIQEDKKKLLVVGRLSNNIVKNFPNFLIVNLAIDGQLMEKLKIELSKNYFAVFILKYQTNTTIQRKIKRKFNNVSFLKVENTEDFIEEVRKYEI